MKHASTATLHQLTGLLAELRTLPDLKEKSAGAFYRNGSAFLHFHEDPAGIFADMKVGGDWARRRNASCWPTCAATWRSVESPYKSRPERKMPYASGRIIHDADAHIMEVP